MATYDVMIEHGRVLTLSFNPSLDKTHVVSGFQPDSIHTAQKTFAVAGGKANNVARVLRNLGHSVRATGFVGGVAGTWVVQNLGAAGIETGFIDVAGDTRTCITIIDEQRRTTTELREQGPYVPGSAQEELLARLPALADQCGIAAVSGSLPPGVSVEFLAQVVQQLQELGLVVLLDVSGPALVAGMRAGPTLIKPNEDELTGLVSELSKHRVLHDGEQKADAFIRLAGDVARRHQVDVVVSLGERGAHWAQADGRGWTVWAPRVEAVNSVGAGDSFLAGLASGMIKGLDVPATLRLGVACGTASVLNYEVAVVDPADVDRLMTHMANQPRYESYN